jgi:hypothetical protein
MFGIKCLRLALVKPRVAQSHSLGVGRECQIQQHCGFSRCATSCIALRRADDSSNDYGKHTNRFSEYGLAAHRSIHPRLLLLRASLFVRACASTLSAFERMGTSQVVVLYFGGSHYRISRGDHVRIGQNHSHWKHSH